MSVNIYTSLRLVLESYGVRRNLVLVRGQQPSNVWPIANKPKAGWRFRVIFFGSLTILAVRVRLKSVNTLLTVALSPNFNRPRQNGQRRMFAKAALLLFLLAVAPFFSLPAQTSHSTPAVESITGAPLIRNYPPGEYGAHNQNWAIAQDQRGVMYFGNSRGLLEYDGVSWRLIQTERKSIVLSMAINTEGRIFAGGYGEIGYFAPDSARQLQFVSLVPRLDEQYHDFKEVWRTWVTPSGVFFVTFKYIFRWDGRKMHIWQAQTAFQYSFWVNDQLYVEQIGLGLMQIDSDSLHMAPDGEKLANMRITAMEPFDNKRKKSVLITSLNQGIFLYDGLSIEHFSTNIDSLLINSKISCATTLANGQYAFGTMLGGVIVIDAAGKLRQRIHKSNGLLDDSVLHLYEDRQGALWIGMQIGIARAETGSPHSYFGERDGIEGSIWEIVRHEGGLYFATIMGLYYLDERPGTSPGAGQFKRVSGVSPQCWSVLPFGQTLLASTFEGVYEIEGTRGRRILEGTVFSLHRSQQDSNRVFAGMGHGVKSLYYNKGQWKEEGRLEGMDQQVRHFYETPDGKLWLTDYFNGLLLVDFSKGYTRQPSILRYDTLHGLPPADRVIAFPTDNGLRFATLQGVFLFDESRQRFFPDTTLVQGLDNDKIALFSVSRDRQGNLWMLADDNAQSGIAIHRAEGVYVWEQTPFLRIAELPVSAVYPDPLQEDITWIGGSAQVVRYDGAVPSQSDRDYPTLLRQIIANEDSLLYGGTGPAPGNNIRLAYGLNSLRFRYAAPSFDDERKNEYQLLLEGYDEQWSNWSTETYKDYTRIPPGNYRFLVRARNIYHHIGETAVCEFEILPPFYRTWWAYLLYVLFLAVGIFRLWQYGVQRIQKMHLQELKQLEYEKLKELDQMKSRFFANISHEFRTPLTLILGPLDNLIARYAKSEDTQDFTLMRRNAQGLLRLINQLLNLSRLEAGKMKLEARKDDVIPLAKGLFYAFESLARAKDISLHFETEMEKAPLYFDREKLEQVITNILSNAFKFTPEGGTVSMKIISEGVEQPNGFLQIDITDTGIGIPAERLGHVFDRFYSPPQPPRRGGVRDSSPLWGDRGELSSGELGGAGIGLALAKELVELHHGRISVDSTVGQGAAFTILLPLGKAHLQAEDIVEEETSHPTPRKRVNPISGDEEGIIQAPLPISLTSANEEENEAENIILLVEDNADMRAFIRTQLADGYQVVEAPDGQAGLEKALEFIPDLIISDVMMPGMDGLQLCDALKNDERTSHIPIILLTAKADVESRVIGLERGADAYLAKPFNREELLVRSRKLLELRQRLRERYASLQPPEPAADKGLELEDAFLRKIRGFVEAQLSDINLDMGQLSQSLGMSRSQVYRKVKALTGGSPSVFVRAIRLGRAKELLQTTDLNVTEVAYEVGFSTPAYFSDAFLEAFGVRPSEFRR